MWVSVSDSLETKNETVIVLIDYNGNAKAFQIGKHIEAFYIWKPKDKNPHGDVGSEIQTR